MDTSTMEIGWTGCSMVQERKLILKVSSEKENGRMENGNVGYDTRNPY